MPFNLFLTTAPNLCDCLLCFFQHNISQKFFHCLSLFGKMLFYNNLCFSSVANATLIICLFLPCFYNISNNTYPPFCKIFLSNSTAFVIAHRSSTSALSNVPYPLRATLLTLKLWLYGSIIIRQDRSWR